MEWILTTSESRALLTHPAVQTQKQCAARDLNVSDSEPQPGPLSRDVSARRASFCQQKRVP